MDIVPATGADDSIGFAERHIGPGTADQLKMLSVLGYSSLDDLAATAVPAAIQAFGRLDLPSAAAEEDVLAELAALAARNEPGRSMIGLGYYRTILPAVIRRNVLESPSWYTAYTPYQPEISQGRLELLLAFQTMVADLSGLPLANASLLDEATAAAEAMALAFRAHRGDGVFLVDTDVHPHTLAVLRTRAEPVGIRLEVRALTAASVADYAEPVVGALLQYPGSSGELRDVAPVVAALKDRGAVVAVASDLLALTLLRPPGEFGADVVIGSAQRFGVPLGFGGPHAGFMAVRQDLSRQLPGRLVGVSVDAEGAPAYRLALQTREQHIRREKATSNICTAQVLLAIISALYAAHHGADGLRAIARRVHHRASTLADSLAAAGHPVVHGQFFDTVRARVPGQAAAVAGRARAAGIHVLTVDDDTVAVACDEATTPADIAAVLAAFGVAATVAGGTHIDKELQRESDFLTHPTFSSYRSETAMLRYLRRLADRDLALDRTMIPLGSCTMKLNAAVEMEPITWPGFADVHPFVPLDAAEGYGALITELESWLAEITGYDAVSVQPNAGSQGELAGLLAIHAFHAANGESHRNVCLIPASAHGTNAASAAMAGMRVVVVACDDGGNVDMDDLHRKVGEHAERLAAIMVTYPSTHGVYEATIADLCAAVHDAGGQVYVDGANLNALVGLARPGRFGADVSHLNLHKTFCIPHGGGGPGVGPVAVRAHLAQYLPGHPRRADGPAVVGPVSAAPFGSAGILPIPWAYIRLMGAEGLKRATQVAILNANYVAHRLDPYFPVLYAGTAGLVAHECILDLRPMTKATGITVDDVAKRLMDYGFHAPTMSFPVAGTLMVEPTESEDLAELDRFCDAMIAIAGEIEQVGAGTWPAGDNPLRNAPHTAPMIAGEWPHPYSREVAAFPVAHLRHDKYWPPVRRIDAAYGDRNLVCSCPPLSAYGD
ncbi:MAG: glycine dehydrogenase [Frankiaceae bacterium]|nr:glycine dehydrogenase [Frankiaceae bacterium]